MPGWGEPKGPPPTRLPEGRGFYGPSEPTGHGEQHAARTHPYGVLAGFPATAAWVLAADALAEAVRAWVRQPTTGNGETMTRALENYDRTKAALR